MASRSTTCFIFVDDKMMVRPRRTALSIGSMLLLQEEILEQPHDGESQGERWNGGPDADQ